jgi:hypothetical protein
MALSFKYPDTFYRLATDVLDRHPEVKHQWIFNEKKHRRELIIPKTQETGFDVGVYCETYGLYPWAGDWWGPCWDINTPKTTFEEMSEEVLALLRILLSPESRIKTVCRGDKVSRLFLEFATPIGWHVHDKHTIHFFAWLGKKKVMIYGNTHLVRRSDFNGEDPLWYKHYKWTD